MGVPKTKNTSKAKVQKTATPTNSPRSYEAWNPATGEKLGEVPCVEISEIPQIFESARRAQRIWEAYSFNERRKHILQIRDYLVNHTEDIATVISKSNGKTLFDALNTEVVPSIMACDWYAKKAKYHLKDKRIPAASIQTLNKRCYIRHVPLGVVGVISPWNYPFSIPFGEIIMGLMAGNAIIYKTSEETPLVGLEIEKALAAGGLPQGLTCFTMGDGPQISTSWLENGVNKIFFTGSVRVGKILMKQAADTLTPLSLELGGNDPMIVMEDANLERAANGALWAGLQNSGQSCAGVERVYVQESVKDEFIALLKNKIENLRHGVDTGNFKIDIGSMTVKRQLDVVRNHVEDALKKGATMEAQSVILPPHSDQFYPATLLTNVTHEMQVMQEETFGPVLGVMSFQSEKEALELANDSDLGLSASVWTEDFIKGNRIAKQIEAGMVAVNDHLFMHGFSEMPWTGWKESGIGVTHSYLGLEEMTKVQAINYDIAGDLNMNLWWLPATKAKYDAMVDTLSVFFGKTLGAKIDAVAHLFPLIRKDPLVRKKLIYVFQGFGKRWWKRMTRNIGRLADIVRRK